MERSLAVSQIQDPRQMLREILDRVSTQPAQYGALFSAKSVGRVLELAAGGSTAPFTTVMELRGDEDQAQVVTVTLVQMPVNSTQPVSVRLARALVEWGSGGAATQRVLMDCLHGVVFSVPAGWLRVSVSNQSTVALANALNVGAFGTHLPIGGTLTHPQFTVVPVAVGGGNTLAATIQPFTRRIRGIWTPVAAAMRMDFLNGAGTIIAAVTVLADQDVLVPATAETVNLVNTNATATTAGLIMELGL